MKPEGRSRRAGPFWQAGVFCIGVGFPLIIPMEPGWKPMPFSVYLPAPLHVLFKSKLRRELGNGYRQHPLQPEHMRELARCLGRYGMPDRNVLIGCQLHDDRVRLDPGVRELLAKCALMFRRAPCSESAAMR